MQRIKYLVIILYALISSHAIVGQNTITETRISEYQRALDLFEKEKYASAQHIFEKFVEENAQIKDEYTINAYYYDAVCAQYLSNNDACYKLGSFIRNFPQSSKLNMARFYLGNYYYADKNYTDALSEYRKVEISQIELSYQAEFEFKFGYSLFQTGNTKKAKEYFSRIMNGKSKYASSALYYYAHIQYEDNDYELALVNFEKLLSDKKFASIVPYYIAQIYFFLDRGEELITISSELIEKSTDVRRAEIEQMVGEVYFRKGDYRKALEYYEKANEIIPQKNDYQMGYCYYQLQEYEKAARYFEKYASENDSIAQNALYHLADVYLKLDKKSEARAMFLGASNMDYSPKIKEDALYNYAKLSCEIGNNPYNESIKSFQDYLKQYPRTSRKNEINEILTHLYFSVRNYKDALELIENLPEKTQSINQAYQRIAINRGIELYNGRKIENAVEMFTKAIKINALQGLTAQAYYLRGESKYQLKNYEGARNDLEKFFVLDSDKQTPYYNQAAYTLGYAQLKLKEHKNSIHSFTNYVLNASPERDKRWIDDVNNRIADNYFVQKSFPDAIAFYDRVIKAQGIDADYALYQKGLAYGALCLYQNKIDCLNLLIARYPKSNYAMSANFEIANTFLLNDDQDMALKFYQVFVNKYPQSSYVKEGFLKIGIIYYNTSRDEEALSALDKVLKDYPGTSESRDALLTIKNIYVNQNRVDEYFNYVKQNTKLSISTVEQDSITFIAAEARYLEGDCQGAIPGFQNYLEKFPNGLFTLTANYYLADCLLRSGSMWKALPHYEYVANQSKSQYTEVSLLNAANITYNIKNYKRSNDFFTRLAAVSEIDANIIQANVGIMRTWFYLESYENAIKSAKNLLQYEKLTNEIDEETKYIIAHSYYALGDTASARIAYEPLKESANGMFSGEAYYREAEAYFNRNNMKAAERIIETITAGPVSDYWLAKSFILWADVYYASGNRLQAKQTLQSIIDNYDGDDLVEEAQQKYDRIVDKENSERSEKQKKLEQKQQQENEIDVTVPLNAPIENE